MTTQPDEPRHVGQVSFQNLVRQRQQGLLPRCPTCGNSPTEIDLEGDPGEHILAFRPCGDRITA